MRIADKEIWFNLPTFFKSTKISPHSPIQVILYLLSIAIESDLCCSSTLRYSEAWLVAYQNHTFKENRFSIFLQLSFTNRSSVNGVILYLHFPPCWDFASLEFEEILNIITNNINWYGQLPYCVQKTKFCCSHKLPLAFTIFLSPLPLWFLGIGYVI